MLEFLSRKSLRSSKFKAARTHYLTLRNAFAGVHVYYYSKRNRAGVFPGEVRVLRPQKRRVGEIKATSLQDAVLISCFFAFEDCYCSSHAAAR